MATRRVVLLILSIGLVGCGGNTPSASPTSQAAIATATPAPTLTPTATPVAPTARPTPKPTPKPLAWTKRERAIRDGIRADVRVGCTPRRQDLPPGTIAAVECRPGKSPASRAGFYLFTTRDEALAVYKRRIYDEGLELEGGIPGRWFEQASGPCADKNYGDSEVLNCRDRDAAFVNSEGYANYRAVRGRMYIGVLGTSRNFHDLFFWARSKATFPDVQSLWCEGAAPSDTGALCADGLHEGDIGG